jgi:hypothetical protein
MTALLLAFAGVSAAQQPEKLLDVMRVTVDGDAGAALVTAVRGPMHDVSCEIVVVGAGLGGVSAALAASNAGHTVCLTEPTVWVGGQATSQGVSAFDDNKWTDTTGGDASYLDLSHRIRTYYAAFRRDTSMTAKQAMDGPISNPGACWVGHLCFEPEPAEKILMTMLQPGLASGRIKLWLHTRPVAVKRTGRRLDSVVVYDFEHSEWLRLHGRYFVDATELGELLPLSGLPFRKGAESQAETHERNAPLIADPHASQSFTYPFVLEKGPVQGGLAEVKPTDYQSYQQHYSMTVDYGHGIFLTYGFYEARKGLPGSFWVYRRSVDASLFDPARFVEDRSMINWSGNDHCDANLLSDDPFLQAMALQGAKRESAGFAWWIRHELPRDDGNGKGYPELTVMQHEMGSEDGLSQHPYIRESRRIIPLRTIVEEDLAVDFQKGARSKLYPDSVGIGWYPIDIHSCDRQDFVSKTKPYEIPLGSLIARDADNLMAAGKVMGTTHITNGAYRLHPTEWAAGEATGTTLAWALEHGVDPAVIDANPRSVEALQKVLVTNGHPIFWYDDVPVSSAMFSAMQMGGARGWWTPDPQTLHADAEGIVSGEEAAAALRQFSLVKNTSLLEKKPQIEWSDIHELGYKTGGNTGRVDRMNFAQWMLQRMQ